MRQASIPAVYMRGGGANGIFFHENDLPRDSNEVDRILLSVMGSPDPYGMQSDGLGKGTTNSSKGVIISRSNSTDFDIDYRFAQIAIDRPFVDWGRSCGNLASAAALFAVEEGLVRGSNSEWVKFRMHQVNRDELILAAVDQSKGLVNLRFMSSKRDTAPLVGGDSIITTETESLGSVEVTLVNATNFFCFISSSALLKGLDESAQFTEVKRRADELAQTIASKLGFGALPRVLLVEGAIDYHDRSGRVIAGRQVDIRCRALSTHGFHPGLPMTAVMAASVAALFPNSVVGKVANQVERTDRERPLRVGHPSGIDQALPIVVEGMVECVEVNLDARRILTGRVHLPTI